MLGGSDGGFLLIMEQQSLFTKKMKQTFIDAFNAIQTDVFNTAKSKGWHDTERNDGEMIALMHSELSEALEALRKDLTSDHISEYSGIEEEFADVIIRIMDMSELRGYNMAEAIIAKAEFNKTREYKHGGKKF